MLGIMSAAGQKPKKLWVRRRIAAEKIKAQPACLGADRCIQSEGALSLFKSSLDLRRFLALGKEKGKSSPYGQSRLQHEKIPLEAAKVRFLKITTAQAQADEQR